MNKAQLAAARDVPARSQGALPRSRRTVRDLLLAHRTTVSVRPVEGFLLRSSWPAPQPVTRARRSRQAGLAGLRAPGGPGGGLHIRSGLETLSKMNAF